MAASFYFYDLETSGINPRTARVMQFAGQRTDMDLNPIGEPHNILIRLSDDVLPEPDAILITGITPQQTIADGISEAEFLKIFQAEVATPETIFVGFNSVRFDDEFVRFLLYRNFHDPYEWQWQDGRSRWDLLDVVRMTRALRPSGIEWPVDSEGKATNRLEYLTKVNKLDHSHAHDALNDVLATIAVAQLIKEKQPKLFDYLLKIRDKREVSTLVNAIQPFVYTSGKYSSDYEKTTVVAKLADHPKKQGVLVYDLRFDPTPYLKMDVSQLVEAWRWVKDSKEPRLPIKSLLFNRCPAVAPMNVLDEVSWQRLGLTNKTVAENFEKLQGDHNFVDRVYKALEQMDKAQQMRFLEDEEDVDARLYDGFAPDGDKNKMSVVRAAGAEELKSLDLQFKDERLQALVPLYKARNYPTSLSDEERVWWEKYRERKLLSGKLSSPMAKFFNRLAELAAREGLTQNQQYLLEELQLYGQSIMPTDLDE
jgi:exodeoxyribonuclease I